MFMTLVFAGFFDKRDLETIRTDKVKIIDTINKDKTYEPIAEFIRSKGAKLDDLIPKLQASLAPLEKVCVPVKSLDK
jgi:hypothetical protein